MTSFPGSPKVLKGGIVLMDPESAQVLRIIPLQYNPESISRSLRVQDAGDSNDRSEALRLTGPPVETYTLEAELDATDQLEESSGVAIEYGLQPTLAALETIIYPDSGQLKLNDGLASAGTIEVLPMEAPLILFIWSKERIMPVRITDFSITEEAFDVNLNPIRAKVNLGMRVLSVQDLGHLHKGGGLFMAYQENKEQLATKFAEGTLGSLGINNGL